MHTTRPFALFITWTCYGTWLPGDARGHVSDTILPDHDWLPKENTPGAEYRRDDPQARGFARNRQRWPSVRLSADEALVVAKSLIETAHQRQWRILQSAVMANHVHVVVADCPDDGPGVRRVLKGNSQAALSRFHGAPRRWWTEGGSNHYLHGCDAIEGTIHYVEDQEYILVAVEDMKIVRPASDGA